MICSRFPNFTRRATSLALFGALAAGAISPLRAQTPRVDSSTGVTTTATTSLNAAPVARPAVPYSRRPSAEALVYANGELRRMSLAEKIGQLISVGVNATFLNRDSSAYKELRRQVESNHVGGIILYRSPVYEAAHLMNRMQRLAVRPLLVSADLEAGTGMRFDDTVNFPWNMAVAATGNTDFARRQGALTAREAQALGIMQVFAPVVDINNNADNPVINVRSYGEDPQAVGRFAVAFVEGLQSGGVMATAKHFPGHGDTSVDSHRGLPVIDVTRARLDELELVPFRQTIAAGVGSIMPGHIGLPQIDGVKITPLPQSDFIRPIYNEPGAEVVSKDATRPASLSPVVLNELLRRELGFDGLIVTDAMDMSGLTIYFKQPEAAVRAVEAGADVLLKPADADACISGLRDAVQTGRLTERRIEDSARRVLVAKYDLGLVANRFVNLDTLDEQIGKPDMEQLASEIAERAITLVRNDAALLPLKNLPPGARILNLAITNGDDRLYVAAPFASALARTLKAMKASSNSNAAPQIETVVLDERSSDADVAQALEKAMTANLIVASLYGRVRIGQGRSVGVPAPGARALNTIIERKSPVVGISFGNPYLLQNFPDLRTYLVAYGDMPSLQQAAARAMFGQADITGKLPISLPGLYPRGTGIEIKAR